MTESVELSHGLVISLSGKRESGRSHGGEEKGFILSWSWLVNVEILERVVLVFLLEGVVGMGGGKVGASLSLHVFGSRCMMALDVGSLFRRIANLLFASWACSCKGGMDASISSA